MGAMRIVTRAEWGAKAAVCVTKLASPVSKFYVHHSARTYNASGKQQTRDIQAFHMGPDRGWCDIAYSFGIDRRDGSKVYEGRGLWNMPGATCGENSDSLAVDVYANYENEVPSDEVIDGIRWLISYCKKQGALAHDATILGHRDSPSVNEPDCSPTSCPGRHLYARMDDIRKPWKEEELTDEEHDWLKNTQGDADRIMAFVRGARESREGVEPPGEPGDENYMAGYELFGNARKAAAGGGGGGATPEAFVDALGERLTPEG